jgi:hypothetical protein
MVVADLAFGAGVVCPGVGVADEAGVELDDVAGVELVVEAGAELFVVAGVEVEADFPDVDAAPYQSFTP